MQSINLDDIKDKVYLTLISVHDFFFFSTFEYNAITTMENVINNYSLIYAFNNNFDDLNINRSFSGTKPFYLSDFKNVKIYSTPAYLLSDFRRYNSTWHLQLLNFLKSNKCIVYDKLIQWDESKQVMFTYNSIGELSTFKMESLRLNFPNLGHQSKFPPLTTFICFTIGEKPPNFIRLGKKLSTCRVQSTPLEKISLRKESFLPHHPVNISELSPDTYIIEGSMLYMNPSSLLINGKINGEFIQASKYDALFNIALPRPSFYPKVFHQ
ncbi:MAG: type I-D CRISPR-associated protein Cas5/Csc1 [Promethearchaeota archaeon]